MAKPFGSENLFFNDLPARFSFSQAPSGLKIHHLHLPEANFMHVGFLVRCGGRQDKPDKQGMAHFTEHLFSKSCSVGKKVLKEFFRENGGSFNFGCTFPDSTTYGFSLPVAENVLGFGLGVFSDGLLAKKLEGYEQEKIIVANEIDRAQGDIIVWERAAQEAANVFHWHPFFSNPCNVIGDKKTLQSFSSEEVQAFHDRYYIPYNMEIVAIGGCQKKDFLALLAKTVLWSDKSNGEVVCLPQQKRPQLPLNRTTFSLNGSKGESFDIKCLAAIPSPKNFLAMNIFVRILDEVLTKKIRESGAGLYNVHSSWQNYGDFCAVSIFADAVSADLLSGVSASINECLIEVGVNKELFENVKRWSLARYGVMDETAKEILYTAATDLRFFGKITSLTERYNSLSALEFPEISAIAEEVNIQLWSGVFGKS